jgi:hypothetical protein
LAPRIGLQRFGSAHDPRKARPLARERVEAAVQICVVGDDHAPRVEMSPRVLQLEEQVAPGVPTVVNEEIDASEPIEERS